MTNFRIIKVIIFTSILIIVTIIVEFRLFEDTFSMLDQVCY